MRQYPLVLAAIWLVNSSMPLSVLAQETPAMDAVDPRYQKLMQEFDRNKEMISIWKDHVRTLTRERDEAYKRLEDLKGDTNGASVNAEVAELKATIETMTRERTSAQKRVEELENQLRAIQPKKPGMTEKELKETRAEKDIILRDKEKALSALETAQKADKSSQALIMTLKDENKKLIAENERLSANEGLLARLRAEKEAMLEASLAAKPEDQEIKADMTRLRAERDALKDENASLEARSQKLDVVESELQDARAYFRSQEANLRALNQKLAAENATLFKAAQTAEAGAQKARQIEIG